MDINQRITDIAAKCGLVATPCGENADWIDPAWHLGPSPEPNMVNGDYYILEECDRGKIGYALVRRYDTEEVLTEIWYIESGWEDPEVLVGMAVELIQQGD